MDRRDLRIRARIVCTAVFILIISCSQQGTTMSLQNAKQLALQFSNAMASRDYLRAYDLTAGSFRQNYSQQDLQSSFEDIVPVDWGEVSPIEVGETMTEWPAKENTDIAWVYVSLGGDMYSEALILIIAAEKDSLKVREIEFGRP